MGYLLGQRKKGFSGMNLTPWTDVPNQTLASPKIDTLNPAPDETYGMMGNVESLASLIGQQSIKPEPDVMGMQPNAGFYDEWKNTNPDPSQPSQTVGMGASLNTNPVLGQAPTAVESKAGLYDNWKTEVFKGMPLDKFVQLTGMAAHALDPKGFGGILGKNVAAMGNQAEQNRLGYEERQASVALNEKRYQEQKVALLQQHKETRAANAATLGEKLLSNKNASLSQKQAGMGMVKEYIKTIMPDITIPDFNPEEDGTFAKEISLIAQDKKLNNAQKKESILDKMHETGKIEDENYVKLRFPEPTTQPEIFGPEQQGPGGTTRQVSSRGKILTITKPEKAERGPKITPNVAVNPATNKNEYLMTDGSFSGQVAGVKPRAEKVVDPATAAVMKALGIDVPDTGAQTPAAGKKQVGTKGGKPVYDLGNGTWQIGD